MGLDLRAAAPHARENVLEVELGLHRVETEVLTPAYVMDELGRGNERLRRNAAVVQAIAPHFVPLDECDASTQARRSCCCNQTGGSSADDDDVVFPLAFFFSTRHGSSSFK
jgi:hypothetical protein